MAFLLLIYGVYLALLSLIVEVSLSIFSAAYSEILMLKVIAARRNVIFWLQDKKIGTGNCFLNSTASKCFDLKSDGGLSGDYVIFYAQGSCDCLTGTLKYLNLNGNWQEPLREVYKIIWKRSPSKLILALGLYLNNTSYGGLTWNLFLLLWKGIRI